MAPQPHLQHFDFPFNVSKSLSVSSGPSGAEGAESQQTVTASLFEHLIRKPDFKSKFIDQIDSNAHILSTLQMSSGARAPINAHDRFEEKIMRSHEFSRDHASESAMLTAFFLMNGLCVVFFLIFGLIVCGCMRRRPRTKSSTPPKESVISVQKPSFRALVSKAPQKDLLAPKDAVHVRRSSGISIKSLARQETIVECGSKRNSVCFEARIRVENDPESLPLADGIYEDYRSSEKESSEADERNDDVELQGDENEEHEIVEADEPSLIRQNLLGPLTFDDLYYT